MKAKKIALCGVLTATAMVLSLVERMFPLDAVIPVPGMKLGLANVITLFALTRLRPREALAILICRVTLTSLLMGSVTAFLFSMLGGLLSLGMMWLLLRVEGRFCTLLGISVAGAAAHNIGQVTAAMLWMRTAAVAAYLPFLLGVSVPLGLVTGLTAQAAFSHLKKIDFNV